jgi:hypothetical protein
LQSHQRRPSMSGRSITDFLAQKAMMQEKRTYRQ